MDLFGKGFHSLNGILNGLPDFRGGSQLGRPQPIVAHLAAFVGVGNGSCFQSLHIGKSLGKARP